MPATKENIDKTRLLEYTYAGYDTLQAYVLYDNADITIYAMKRDKKYLGYIEVIPSDYMAEGTWLIETRKEYKRELEAREGIELIFNELVNNGSLTEYERLNHNDSRYNLKII